jgi:hypothetical protein
MAEGGALERDRAINGNNGSSWYGDEEGKVEGHPVRGE